MILNQTVKNKSIAEDREEFIVKKETKEVYIVAEHYPLAVDFMKAYFIDPHRCKVFQSPVKPFEFKGGRVFLVGDWKKIEKNKSIYESLKNRGAHFIEIKSF
jgi:hypothetical protein